MTVAVAEALMDTNGQDADRVKEALVESMRRWGRRYPDAGYGGMFARWLESRDPKPYGSFGNGSAMRVSAAGWLYDTLEATRHAAALTAMVTHNHPEGVKGAEAAAGAIFMAWATAWADSIAGMMPSVRARYSKACTASSSVTGTYSARPISWRYACSGPIPG